MYKISCDGKKRNNEPCSDISYIGETSRSIGERYNEHMYNIKNKNVRIRQKSFLFDHVQGEHNGQVPPLKLEILRRCPGDPGLRQATEAVCIRDFRPPLNEKDE